MGFNKKNLANDFKGFMDANLEEISYFKNARDQLKHLIDQERVSSDIFESWGNKDTFKETYELLDVNSRDLISLLNDLVKHLEVETKRLQDYYFNNLDFEEITSINEFEKMCIGYNQVEHRLLKEIEIKTPGIFKLEDNIYGIKKNSLKSLDKLFKTSAENFIKFYLQLYKSIKFESKKDIIFVALIQAINYLNNYIKQSSTISQNWANNFIIAAKNNFPSEEEDFTNVGLNKTDDEINVQNGLETFLRVYFSAGVASSFSANLTPYLEKLDWKNNLINKPYEDANNDYKLDKLLKSILIQLFENVKFETSSGETNIKKLASKITKVGDNMSQLKDEFKNLIHEFQIAINQKYSFKRFRSGKVSGFDNIQLMMQDGTFNKISDFNNDFFNIDTNKSKAEFIITELESALSGEDPWDNNTKFEAIMKLNKKLFVSGGGGTSSSILSKSDIKKIIYEFSSSLTAEDKDVDIKYQNLILKLFKNTKKIDEDYFKGLVFNYRGATSYSDLSLSVQDLVNKVINFINLNKSLTIDETNKSIFEDFINDLLLQIFI